MRKRYTKEYKLNIVSQFESGQTVKCLCAENHLPRSIVYEWIKLYQNRQDRKGSPYQYVDVLDLQKQFENIGFELHFIKENEMLSRVAAQAKVKSNRKVFRTICCQNDVSNLECKSRNIL